MHKSPEEELEQFLASLPSYQRKAFEEGFSSLTEDEFFQACRDFFAANMAVRENYERLLRRAPEKWKEYRARERNAIAQVLMPPNLSGRPRKDALAQEAVELQQRGMNCPQIATELNKRHGEDTTTPAAIPKLLKRYLARTKSSA